MRIWIPTLKVQEQCLNPLHGMYVFWRPIVNFYTWKCIWFFLLVLQSLISWFKPANNISMWNTKFYDLHFLRPITWLGFHRRQIESWNNGNMVFIVCILLCNSRSELEMIEHYTIKTFEYIRNKKRSVHTDTTENIASLIKE